MMAQRLGVAFDPLDLTLDPGLNMRLGAAYLAELRDEFGHPWRWSQRATMPGRAARAAGCLKSAIRVIRRLIS